MYPKLILRNVFRNLQTYTIYFFSLTLIYSLLYAFNALPSHPVMQSLSGAKEMLTTVMSQYMGLLSYLILSAIAFLVVYSTNFVLGRRKKELGLYATLGMKKKQIIGTLNGHKGDWIQPLVAGINCTLWVAYGLWREKKDWPIVIANAPGIIFGGTAAITALM